MLIDKIVTICLSANLSLYSSTLYTILGETGASCNTGKL